jgi:uncharacterized LabA/DUF88 family protein
MPVEPVNKRVVAFVDGQNLFFAAKDAFGYNYPNYDVKKLCASVAYDQPGWNIIQERFYTGMPDQGKDASLYQFWNAKLASMGRAKIYTFTRPLKYRNETVTLLDGTCETVLPKREKGIDVRLALDMVRLAIDNVYDVALLFSQDQDLSEVVDELKSISRLQNRWICMASSYPTSATSYNSSGVRGTKWIPIDQAVYDSCIDPVDYRSKR